MNADIRATRRAYQEIDLPKYVKGTLEFIFDPINAIPYIGIVNDIKTASKVLKATAVGGTRLTVAGATTGAKAAVATPSAIRDIPSTTGAAVQNLKARINFAKGPEPETFDYDAVVDAYDRRKLLFDDAEFKQFAKTIKEQDKSLNFADPNKDIVDAIETRFAFYARHF
jgi:hypothetical protein